MRQWSLVLSCGVSHLAWGRRCCLGIVCAFNPYLAEKNPSLVCFDYWWSVAYTKSYYRLSLMSNGYFESLFVYTATYYVNWYENELLLLCDYFATNSFSEHVLGWRIFQSITLPGIHNWYSQHNITYQQSPSLNPHPLGSHTLAAIALFSCDVQDRWGDPVVAPTSLWKLSHSFNWTNLAAWLMYLINKNVFVLTFWLDRSTTEEIVCLKTCVIKMDFKATLLPSKRLAWGYCREVNFDHKGSQ